MPLIVQKFGGTSVADPQKIKPGCLMAPFKLSEQHLDRLVDYFMTLE